MIEVREMGISREVRPKPCVQRTGAGSLPPTLDGLVQTWFRKTRFLENPFTKLQGQYLAFIVAYTKLNRRGPAEADFQRYFSVTPPSVHNMIVTLERHGLIKRTPGRARSIEVLVPLNEVPPPD
jgi:hypothetical protein